MERIAEQMLEEAQDGLEARIARIEPTMVLVCSVLVGGILLCVMLPLIHILSAIG
jgi:type IV pilus assembly protein PilC